MAARAASRIASMAEKSLPDGTIGSSITTPISVRRGNHWSPRSSVRTPRKVPGTIGREASAATLKAPM
jgi:hypothetical protein